MTIPSNPEVAELSRKIDALTGTVQGLVGTVQGLVDVQQEQGQQVSTILDIVQATAERVNALTEDVAALRRERQGVSAG